MFTELTSIFCSTLTENDKVANVVVVVFFLVCLFSYQPIQRTSLNDFERFKLRYAKKARNKLLTAAYNTLKKRTKADGTARVLKKDRKVRIEAAKAKGGKKGAKGGKK